MTLTLRACIEVGRLVSVKLVSNGIWELGVLLYNINLAVLSQISTREQVIQNC